MKRNMKDAEHSSSPARTGLAIPFAGPGLDCSQPREGELSHLCWEGRWFSGIGLWPRSSP